MVKVEGRVEVESWRFGPGPEYGEETEEAEDSDNGRSVDKESVNDGLQLQQGEGGVLARGSWGRPGRPWGDMCLEK